jgi:hypothetical protein
VVVTGILKDIHGNPDVMPERVRSKGEPTDEPSIRPPGRGRRSGPRRSGR